MNFEKCWFLTGATASGKTAVGIDLARLLGAEIVSMDSMAVYRGMDVGTAKPSAGQRLAVPHYLIDIASPDEDFSVATYLAAAESLVAAVQGRGRKVLFVGGTPLYLKALLRGIFEGPPADWDLRRQLEQFAEANGPLALHERLAQVDPDSARRLHPRDARRLIRAIEVYEITGQPISALQRQFDHAQPASGCRVFVLDWPREALMARIDARVDAMFAAGLVAEVERLLDRGRRFGRTSSKALGYREVIEHLAGERDLPATIELVKRHSRQFAKRQLTWFRSLSECRAVSVAEPFNPVAVAWQIHDAGQTVI